MRGLTVEVNGRHIALNGRRMEFGRLSSSSIEVDGRRVDQNRPNFSKKPINSIRDLKSTPVRYLPPSGPYFDQHDLQTIFGDVFEERTCVNCLSHDCKIAYLEFCTRECGVCNTSDHISKACPKLYCTYGWWLEHRHTPPAAVHIRPGYGEAAVLSKEGFIRRTRDNYSEIIPIHTHRVVEAFYGQKPVPQKITKIGHPSSSEPPSVMEHSTPNIKNSPSERQIAVSSRMIAGGVKSSVELPPVTVSQGDEMCIQELEDRLMMQQRINSEQAQTIASLKQEVTQLKNEGVIKDRQIRQLTTENTSFRGHVAENRNVGNKRQRFD